MSYPPRVVLREVVDSDLPIFFEHQRDPEAARMAAFPSRDHDAFMTHWAKLRREPPHIIRTVVCDGQVAGNIGSWFAEDRWLINPGSVGQPRDRDPRASYVVWDVDERRVHSRRVPYDVASASAKIAAAGLPRFLSDRLAAGI